MISLRQLKYFVEIVAAGSYTRASERLYIAQSALSRQIKELESDMDVVLLRRDAKQIELTQAAWHFMTRPEKFSTMSSRPFRRRVISARVNAARSGCCIPVRCHYRHRWVPV